MLKASRVAALASIGYIEIVSVLKWVLLVAVTCGERGLTCAGL